MTIIGFAHQPDFSADPSIFIGKTSNEKVGESWWYNMAMHEIIKNQASSKMPG